MNFTQIKSIHSFPLLNQVIALDHNFMSYAWSEKQWQCLDESRHQLFVIGDDVLLGFALYLLSPHEELAHLLKIVMAPTEQGRQSQGFFAMQKSSLAKQGFKRIYLEVAETNIRALKFYQKVGFNHLQTIKSYYSDGASALMMELLI